MTVERRIRLGMIGGGQGAFIGAVHRIAARLDDRYELVAGALSSNPARAAASAAELHIEPDRSYASFDEMAAAESNREDGIDVAAIVTPNHVHYPAAKAMLEAGIHVICDKPMTTTVEDSQSLVSLVEKSGLIFGLTHNYTGYPMVRQARDMVAGGDLGKIRVVQVEYLQDWLSTKQEDENNKQAQWRTDPERSGLGGCIGDIGTHAYNLAGFISGLQLEEICADLHTFVDGRQLDDNVHVMMRYRGGAKGTLWSSQVCPGKENGLRIRIYGEKAGLEWAQEDPNYLHFTPLGDTARLITRGGASANETANLVTRTPSGHPEGYLEGFANLYSDVANQIQDRWRGQSNPSLVPTVKDGLDGVRFIVKAVESSQEGGRWISF